MSYTFKENTKDILEAMERAKIRALKAIGMTAERHAKKDTNMPVDTGLARNSITFALSGEEANTKEYADDHGNQTSTYDGRADGKKGEAVFLGSNVEYFPFIELGSRTMTARHVLANAASNHGDEYQKLMEDSMKNA